MDRVLRQFASWTAARSGRPNGSTATTTHRARKCTSARLLWVSRKGAIRAEAGDPGLIPGSMGTASYVVAGLGNRSR